MKSNYDGSKCPKCGGEIKKGDDISKDGDQPKWHHTKCPTHTPPQAPDPNQTKVDDQPEPGSTGVKLEDKVIFGEAEIVYKWAIDLATLKNFPKEFDKNSATTDQLRARQIDRNVDKKLLFAAFYAVKYGKKI